MNTSTHKKHRGTRTRCQQIPDATWELHKETIRKLFKIDKLRVKGEGGVMETMARVHGFRASGAQYETRLRKWGFQKNATRSDWRTLDLILQKREAENKKTNVYLHEELVSEEKLRKERLRNRDSEITGSSDQDLSLSLPRPFRIESPTPDETRISQPFSPLQTMPDNLVSNVSWTLPPSTYDEDSSLRLDPTLDTMDLYNDPVFPTNPLDGFLNEDLASFNSFNGHPLDLVSIGPQTGFGNGRLGSPFFDGSILFDQFNFGSYSNIHSPILLQSFDFIPDSWLGGTASMMSKLMKTMSPIFPIMSSLIGDLGDPIPLSDLPLTKMWSVKTCQDVQRQPLDVQLVFTVVFLLANNLIILDDLQEPKTAIENLILGLLRKIHSLPAYFLDQFLEAIPLPLRDGLKELIFCAAMHLGATGAIETLLERGIDLQSARVQYRGKDHSPIELAARLQHVDVVDVLLRRGADPKIFIYYHPLRASLLKESHMGTVSPAALKIFSRFLCNKPIQGNWLNRVTQFQDPCLDLAIVENIPDADFGIFIENKMLTRLTQRIENEIVAPAVISILNRPWSENDREDHRFQTEISKSLSNAAYRNNHAVLDFLMKFGAESHVNCLRNAVLGRNIHAVECFLDAGISTHGNRRDTYDDGELNSRNSDFPLALAIKLRFTEVVRLFRQRGYFSNFHHLSEREAKETILAACEIGDDTLVDELIPQLASQDRVNDYRTNWDTNWDMVQIIKNGHQRLIKRVFEAGLYLTPSQESIVATFADGDFFRFLINISSENVPWKGNIIYTAVGKGDIETIEMLLEIGVPLHLTCDFSDLRHLDWPTTPPEGNDTLSLMSTAILTGHSNILDALLDLGVPIVRTPNDGVPDYHILRPLSAAVYCDDLELVKKLLTWGLEPDGRSLHAAYLRKRLDILGLFVANIRHRYPKGGYPVGTTALFEAVSQADTRMVAILAGISNCNHEHHLDSIGYRTPLKLAIDSTSESWLNMVRILMENGGRLEPTCLLHAISTNELLKVKGIVELGARTDMPARGSTRWTPLQSAVYLGTENIVEYLLQLGVNPNESPAALGGYTALQCASKQGNLRLAPLLLKCGADVNAPGAMFNGRTALEVAAEYGRVDMVMYLVRCGADMISNNGKQYNRAVQLAEKKGHRVMKTILDDLYSVALGNLRTGELI